MNDKDRALEYLKCRKTMHIVSSILDCPILILLWIMNYHTAFWILLALVIVGEIQYGAHETKLEKLAGVECE